MHVQISCIFVKKKKKKKGSGESKAPPWWSSPLPLPLFAPSICSSHAADPSIDQLKSHFLS
jgi:hypothetical protein